MAWNITLRQREGWDTSLKDRNFFKENFAVLTLCPLFVLVISLLSSLYGLTSECVFYLISFLVLIWSFAVAVQYKCYKRTLPEEADDSKDRAIEQQRWEIMREKEDFFSLWAHQIKTPIAALKLLFQADEQDSGACKRELLKIEGYVEMALGYTRFESLGNDLKLYQCNLDKMVKEVTKKQAIVFINKHLTVELDNLDYYVLTDEKWFSFVLEQLLTNALKYTSDGGIRIYAKEKDDGLEITVSDTGIGIKKEDIPRIFEKGFTGYNGRLDKKASGLGLYLCSGICEKLGHKISVESELDKGTQVHLLVRGENIEKDDLTKM